MLAAAQMTRDNRPITSIRRCRDYERVPCCLARVIALGRESSSRWSVDDDDSLHRASAVASRLRPIYPPKSCRLLLRRESQTAIASLARGIPATARLLVLVDVATPPVIHFQHSQAFPRFWSALLPYRSAMLGGVGEQSEPPLVFLLSLPLPSPFSPFFPFLFLAARRRVPLIRASRPR